MIEDADGGADEVSERAKEVAADCMTCAAYIERMPGAAGALTMIDLYRAIARLARIVEAQQNEIDTLSAPSR